MAQYPVRFGIQTPPQLVGWEEMCELWQRADDLGYDSLWTFDHFFPMQPDDPAGPCLEGWTALAALSQHTRRAHVGTLVNGNTYRNPCLTAKMAVTLDHASGGRFNLGIGAGWYELEHNSFGIDFMTIRDRLRALDEACTIIRSMFTNEKTTFKGRHYAVTDAFCAPKPIQKPHPPLMVAGGGEKVMLKIVARHADMWNSGGSAERISHLIDVIKRHGDTVGRDSDEIEKTVVMGLCYRASKEREQDALRGLAATGLAAEDARKQMMIGGREECLATIERYLKAGATHFIFSLMHPYHPDEVQGFAEEVMPQVKGRAAA